MNRFVILFALTFNFFIHADDEWMKHWAAGLEQTRYVNYPKAIDEYSLALHSLGSYEINKHLYLYLERGSLYNKGSNFDQAIQDFTTVINNKEAKSEEIETALWGRTHAYLASGKTQDFLQDCKRLEQIQAYNIQPEQENQQYFIFKLGTHLQKEKKTRDALVKALLLRGSIVNENDVLFGSSGMAMVKKAKPAESLSTAFSGTPSSAKQLQ